MTRESPTAAKDLNRSQFGANAANYVGSKVHAKGASLARMVELAEPQSSWTHLDIATGAGHTAFAFAPHVESVIASDLTPEMLEVCADHASKAGHDNLTTEIADAEALPFEDGSFDLVTCRIAPHHFPNPTTFVAEVARVLRPGGRFVMVDNIVPENERVAHVYNTWEKRRDPSHVRALPVSEWHRLLKNAGLTLKHSEEAAKRMQFQAWVDNMNVPADVRPLLLNDLLGAEPAVANFLKPHGQLSSDTTFELTEGLIVSDKAVTTP